MYFLSKNSSFESEYNVYGTLIGVHGNWIYAANSTDTMLEIFRKKVFDTEDWEPFWTSQISCPCNCGCNEGVSVAYGVVAEELFVLVQGKIVSLFPIFINPIFVRNLRTKLQNSTFSLSISKRKG